jgi:nucleoside-diphosphate-sugar epimerase
MRREMGASSTNSRHVLVVGGAGYLGNVLVRRLLADGCRVRVLDRLLFDHGSALAGLFEQPGFEFLRGDLVEPADVERSLEGVTDVILLAALVGDPICRKYPDLARRVNDEGAKRLFDALAGRGIDRFVFTSTCSNYGLRETEEPATEESELAPLSLYAETKVEFERFVLAREPEWDLCPTLLRIATAYGLSPRMRFDLTISEFTRTLAIGQELVVYDADTWRPYCHVRDISAAIATVLSSPEEAVRGEVFNIGHDDGNFTKRMVVDAVQEHLGGSGSVRFTEGGQDPRNYRVSFDKVRERLGFEPQHTIPETVGTLIEAIRAGAFNDVEARPTFYTNNTAIADDEAAVHEEAGGSD